MTTKPYVNVSGTYKPVSNIFVNVGGTWKTVSNGYVNVGGTWKQFYQRLFTLDITASATSINLRTLANAGGYDGASPVQITIGSAATISATNYTVPAISTGAFPSTLTLINQGTILGAGGNGSIGTPHGVAGTAGGDAISLGTAITITNTGHIFGGGGGGGGGGNSDEGAAGNSGGGGGGGQGLAGGTGGPGSDQGHGTSGAGGNGSQSGPGAGGAPVSNGGYGGAGGTWGQPGVAGQAGTGPNYPEPGAGGAAGYAVRFNGFTCSFTEGLNGILVLGQVA